MNDETTTMGQQRLKHISETAALREGKEPAPVDDHQGLGKVIHLNDLVRQRDLVIQKLLSENQKQKQELDALRDNYKALDELYTRTVKPKDESKAGLKEVPQTEEKPDAV